MAGPDTMFGGRLDQIGRATGKSGEATGHELLLRGKIDEQEGKEIEIRTQGKRSDYKSYCYILYKGAGYGAVELETYHDEMDAREGHLRWLRKRDRCLSYLEALGILRRGRRLFD
jgi:hypothetical protein